MSADTDSPAARASRRWSDQHELLPYARDNETGVCMEGVILIPECALCRKKHRTLRAAQECYRQGVPPAELSVGDIVIKQYSASHGPGDIWWFDGDERWICRRWDAQPKHKDSFWHRVSYSFFYVVVRVCTVGDISENTYCSDFHRRAYVLATRAMTGEHGYRYGWTTFDGHIKVVKADPQPELPGIEELLLDVPMRVPLL